MYAREARDEDANEKQVEKHDFASTMRAYLLPSRDAGSESLYLSHNLCAWFKHGPSGVILSIPEYFWAAVLSSALGPPVTD